MSYFAEVLDGVVVRVLAFGDHHTEDTVSSMMGGGAWVQTSYNTRGGVHVQGGEPLRKNFAASGNLYDGVGFFLPQPLPSWVRNSETYSWEPPIPRPSEGFYSWSEDQHNSTGNGWVAVEQLQ
jgi:hypothetical protein